MNNTHNRSITLYLISNDNRKPLQQTIYQSCRYNVLYMEHSYHIHDNHHTGETGTTANNIFIPERPQPIKCRTIYHHIKPLQYNRTLYYKIEESIYINGKGESIYAVLFAF